MMQRTKPFLAAEAADFTDEEIETVAGSDSSTSTTMTTTPATQPHDTLVTLGLRKSG